MTERATLTLHYAQSLDGRIATCLGDSQWISGQDTLRYAHTLRAAHDAIMVGVGTVMADNPSLTVRLAPPSPRPPRRIVVDSTLRLPLTARVLDDRAPTLIATTNRAPAERLAALQQCVEVAVLPEDSAGRVDLPALLRLLPSVGVNSVLLEGGSAMITSALRLQLADRLTVCIAPLIIGSGTDAVGNLDVQRLGEAIRCTGCFRVFGEDVVFDGQPQYA